MNSPRNLKILIIPAVVAVICLSLRMIAAAQEKEWVWAIAGVAVLISALMCCWGMLHLRRWALWLSYLLAVVVLSMGLYVAKFSWSFWLFQQPALWDRIKRVIDPRVSLLIACPIFWLIYFTRSKTRSIFN